LVQRDAGARPGQIDGPHVMEWQPARKSWTRSGSRSNSCLEIWGIGPPGRLARATDMPRSRCATGLAREGSRLGRVAGGLRQEAGERHGIEVEHLAPNELAVPDRI